MIVLLFVIIIILLIRWATTYTKHTVQTTVQTRMRVLTPGEHDVFIPINAPKVLLSLPWQRRYFEWVPQETILSGEIHLKLPLYLTTVCLLVWPSFVQRIFILMKPALDQNISFKIYHERLCKQQWIKVFARYTHDTEVNGDYRNSINFLDRVRQYGMESVSIGIATILNIKTKKKWCTPEIEGIGIQETH